MQAGVKLALRELAGLPGAVSRPRPQAKKIILFLTDGKPSLPFGLANVEDKEDMLAAIDAAQLAKVAGVMMNVYGLGPSAIDYPVAATEMAKATGGLYTPVRRPGDIVALLSGVSFANVEDVVAVNLTLMEWAGPNDILLAPDGSFQGFVPVRAGMNRIRVSALASDGSRGSTEFDIDFAQQAHERPRARRRSATASSSATARSSSGSSASARTRSASRSASACSRSASRSRRTRRRPKSLSRPLSSARTDRRLPCARACPSRSRT